MTTTQTDAATARKPLRVWPGVVIAILQVLGTLVVPLVAPDATIYSVLAGLAGGLAIALWWLFFSRAAWTDRLGALALVAITFLATRPLLHESIATGAMGMLFPILALPIAALAFVAWAVAARRLPDGPRRVTMVATIVLACAAWTLVRTGGFTGNFDHDFHWRWTQTPEERLLTQTRDEPRASAAPAAAVPAAPPVGTPEKPAAPTAAETAAKPTETTAVNDPAASTLAAVAVKTRADWPGFRGPARDGIVRGVQIKTDWSASPPVELWRRAVGPGWSSFAVRGDLFYTQEQRGDEEIVACYNANTGEPVWKHSDAARFWESNGGAGPRGTPTLSNGRVYTLGATGIVNALDARTGARVWSRNAASDTGAKLPMWGFSGSPLVVGDLVIVAASGGLIAYDIATGNPRWRGPVGEEGYSSPQLMTIDGVPQVVLVSGTGATAVAPNDGARLWEHAWKGYPIVQPAQTADGDILISVNESSGTRRLAVTRGSGGWTVEERWTSMALKPYFNDFVVHKGHAFGFDGFILACIDLADGTRKWKGGRYGNGQLVLLPDQDLLLVLSEEGEVALVNATPDKFTEVARSPAIDGKTWNHPVLVGSTLLARNGEEMVAFRLSLATR